VAAARKRTTARAAAVRARPVDSPIRRLAPSWRSLAVGIGIAAFAIGAYAIARETSLFAVRDLRIEGGSTGVQAEVRSALIPELGRSLLVVSLADVDRLVAPLPDVRSVTIDRTFPHTLRVLVRPERAVLVLRRGKNDAWAVSTRGRVMRKLAHPERSSLPRTWVPKATTVTLGELLPRTLGGLAATALVPARAALGSSVRFVRSTGEEVTLVLRSGLEIRLGGTQDLRLKLAIARRIVAVLGTSTTSGYLDVSVPERPVVGPNNPQAGGTA
jgi:cell division protein FtsQ